MRGTIGRFVVAAAFAACAVVMSRDGDAGFNVWLCWVLGGIFGLSFLLRIVDWARAKALVRYAQKAAG